MSKPYRLDLPRTLYQEMLDQARAELPNECCGLLAGTIRPGTAPGQLAVGEVQRRYPLVNERASPTEFFSEPRSMFQATRDIECRGFQILAIYHSHPTTDPVPSRTDRERSYYPLVMNLIISLKENEPRMAAWWVSPEEHSEAEWTLS